ncbi:glycoside hydrolase family 6 protein [Nocardioides bruguierae]|uniref:glycoside hydrolase family 6 protein n=1 Tax=Nocardioides bruguierae TaxID=2945102 RepID=UPI00202015A5|nr:glycoside hydrolase family 6 protein [Nocardioides bruguierae]MCL8026650.1 glycoside hydrolase family 6 protein [Nocardioides bruguierae]
MPLPDRRARRVGPSSRTTLLGLVGLTAAAVLLGLLPTGSAGAQAPAATTAPTALNTAPNTGLNTGPSTGLSSLSTDTSTAARKDPRRRLGLFVDDHMPVHGQGRRYRGIAKFAQALWLSHDYYATREIKGVARAYLRRAKDAGKTPILVVYSLPNRDCGGWSSGGASGKRPYKRWVSKLAEGIKGSKPLLVLEPDALPFYGQHSCEGTKPWPELMRFATKRLSAAGAWVYLDAGHSGWTPYKKRARLLERAGVQYARGFSTNVSNFRPTGDEKRYARFLVRRLKALGVTGVHYVVDTSRNGAKDPVDGDVINPTWARIGAGPRLLFRRAFDGRLWVKHPGESDGEVNGGNASGSWCDLLADRLMGRSKVRNYC